MGGWNFPPVPDTQCGREEDKSVDSPSIDLSRTTVFVSPHAVLSVVLLRLSSFVLVLCVWNLQYLPISTTKGLVRKVWDTTSNSDMSHLLGWVMATLRIRGQRVRSASLLFHITIIRSSLQYILTDSNNVSTTARV